MARAGDARGRTIVIMEVMPMLSSVAERLATLAETLEAIGLSGQRREGK
jgi:hypothetical protein